MCKKLMVMVFASFAILLLCGLGVQAATVINLDDAFKQVLTNPPSDAQINKIDSSILTSKPNANLWGTVLPDVQYVYQKNGQWVTNSFTVTGDLESWLLLKQRFDYKNLQMENYQIDLKNIRNSIVLKVASRYLQLMEVTENQKALDNIRASFDTYYKVLTEKVATKQVEPLLYQKATFYKNKLQVMADQYARERKAIEAELVYYLDIKDSNVNFTIQDSFETLKTRYSLVENWNLEAIENLVASQPQVVNFKNDIKLAKMNKSINDLSNIMPNLSYGLSIDPRNDFKMSLEYGVNFDWQNLNLFNGTRVYFSSGDDYKRLSVSFNTAGQNLSRDYEKKSLERYNNLLNFTIHATTTGLTDLMDSLQNSKSSVELAAEEKALKDAEIRDLAGKLENDKNYVDLLKMMSELAELTETYHSEMSLYLDYQFEYKMVTGNL